MYDDRNQHLSILTTFHLFISWKEKIFEKDTLSTSKDKTLDELSFIHNGDIGILQWKSIVP